MMRRWNIGLGILHLAQGVAMLALSNDFALPVTGSFLVMDPATQQLVAQPDTLFELRIAPLVASFLFVSAAAHLSLATWARDRYEGWLERGIQPGRWIEYAASSSVMIVVIAMLSGIGDVATLLLAFGANAAMILFGWVMETRNEGRERVDWMPFWFGVFVGVLPWIAIAIYLFGAGDESGGPPGFVYAIFASLFVFFNIFAINMVLQYRKVGRWREYRYGERAYMLLSLIAKSILAWQVFAGTLRPV